MKPPKEAIVTLIQRANAVRNSLIERKKRIVEESADLKVEHMDLARELSRLATTAPSVNPMTSAAAREYNEALAGFNAARERLIAAKASLQTARDTTAGVTCGAREDLRRKYNELSSVLAVRRGESCRFDRQMKILKQGCIALAPESFLAFSGSDWNVELYRQLEKDLAAVEEATKELKAPAPDAPAA